LIHGSESNSARLRSRRCHLRGRKCWSTRSSYSVERREGQTIAACYSSREKGRETESGIFDRDAEIYALWKGEALKAGDKIRAVWIAEDVGNVAPKNSRITEAFVTAEKSDDDGAFGLARPTDGWPVGKYRLEIYVGDKLAEALKFKIQPGVTVELH